ncbi:hypothetical protein M4R36_00290 [Acidovorax sp. GBBC 3299]|nr:MULTISPECIES: hypothetical protein [unclassified Acidovorax]MDA8448470.1 hypothetical protein [Acidovorax sp. GBBC 3297]MDA8457563.1 hypothetical protein [Acidovorax sp. GBBC 3333]MDA8467633.1 hypothetical protein [Acidovorax sp. GBBC 3299]
MSSRSTTRRAASDTAPTLAEQALQAEEARHACRLAAIKSMDARLRMFEDFMPAVRAAGIKVHGEEFNGWGTSTLYVSGITLDPRRNATLEKVLREQGMEEIERTPYLNGAYTVKLRKGRLTVSITVETHRLNRMQESQACA